MMLTDEPKTIYLKDYKPFPYEIGHCDLSFDIRDEKTIVTNKLELKRQSQDPNEIYLNGFSTLYFYFAVKFTSSLSCFKESTIL